jgi:hypothetical protein
VSGCVYLVVMYQFALEKQERVFVKNKVVGIYSRVIRTQGV